MLLEDPYQVLHNCYSRKKQYLENLEHTTGIKPNKGCLSTSEVKQMEVNMNLTKSLNPAAKSQTSF